MTTPIFVRRPGLRIPWLAPTVALLVLSLGAAAAGQEKSKGKAGAKDKPAEKTAETPLEAAKSYTGLMKSGKGAEAVKRYWDTDTMLAGIFGERLKQHGEAERKEMRDLFQSMLGKINSNPEVVKMMARAKIEDFKEEAGKKDDECVVTFLMKVNDKEIPNTLHFRKGRRGWLIVDAGVRGRMMVPGMRAQYAGAPGEMTPLEFVRALAEQTNAPAGK